LAREGYLTAIPHFETHNGVWRGSFPFVYGLTDKGVREYGGKTFSEHSARTLDHELEISLFHIALKQFCERNGLKLYWQQSDLKRGIHPDALFKLIRDGQQLSFFLEIEKQKMNGRRGDEEPNVIKKLRRYADYYDTPECKKDWNFGKFRVIVVHKNAERMENLLAALHAIPELNQRMFWLTAEKAYKDDIGAEIFLTPRDFENVTYSFLVF
jgi:hypothetical protein